MKPVRFHQALDAEVQEAARFYDSLRAGLGNGLLESIEQATHDIQRAPTSCQYVRGRVRKRRLKRFLSAVIFENQDDCIHIIALAHDHRQPDYWLARLTPGE